ncbi:MAG: hydrolase, partial [bacterium]|nr:hydrolase [bacterium]
MKRSKKWALSVIGLLFIVTVGAWYVVLLEERNGILTVAFLDVGQGDAIFIDSPTGRQVLIDGGPGRGVLREL